MKTLVNKQGNITYLFVLSQVFAVLIVAATAAETRDKRGLFGDTLVSSAALHHAPILTTAPLLGAYDHAPLVHPHALHSPLLSSAPILSSSLLGSSLYSPSYYPSLYSSSLYSPLYGANSYYSPSIHSPLLSSSSLLGSHGPVLTSLSAPHFAAHSTPIITHSVSPAVTVVKSSSVVHSSNGHTKHAEQKVSTVL